MTLPLAHEASIPNPALAAFTPFIGTWTTVGHHPMIEGTLHGRTTIEWHDGGAFICIRSEIDEPQVPSGISYVGSDDEQDSFTMLYFDERGVSRRYEVAMDEGVMHWWRDAPGFRQRYTLTVSADGDTLQGRGELARHEDAWGPDLELTYTRVTR
jgi:hypothetical protein